MADTLDVVTLTEAKTALKIDETGNDTRLASAITAVSRRLDDLCGPIVKRTITAEEIDACGQPHVWLRWRPVLSITSVADYDASGTLTALTAEDYDTKPSNAYLAERREGLGATYSGRIFRRSGGYGYLFSSTALVTYVAGRYDTTAAVDAVFKEAAYVTLINWWQQVLAQPGQQGIELDLPGYRFPGFAVPNAALEIIPVTERRTRVAVA